MLLIIMQFYLFLISSPTAGRDYGQWNDRYTLVRPSIKQFDNPVQSCSGEADAFQADKLESSAGPHVTIPNGNGNSFVGSNGQLFCYVSPGGV